MALNYWLNEKLLKLLFFFFMLKLVFVGLDFLINKQFMQLFKIQELVSNDLSFNDLYYRIQYRNVFGKEHFTREKTVVLINAGSLSADHFRLELAKLIHKVDSFHPKMIGIDFIFSDYPKNGTKELEEVLKTHPGVVTGVTPESSVNLMFKERSNSGDISFHSRTKTIRYYNSSSTSFAYQLAGLGSFGDKNSYPAKDHHFPIHYCCVHDGLVHIRDVNHPFRDVNFKFVEAEDILNDTSDFTLFLKDRIIIIGHLGASCLPDRNSDMSDKFCVPTDTLALANRDPVMYGAVIHANAVENLLHQSTAFRVWDGNIYALLINLFYLGFIAFILFTDVGKFYNILIMTLLTIPLLFLVLWLMEKNVYMTMGMTLLNLLIIEEIAEMIEPLYTKVKNGINTIKLRGK